MDDPRAVASPGPRGWAAWAVSAVAAIAAVGWFVHQHRGGLYDDAFIYLRYARHLAAGCGLRWNCGDAPVEGFTGPLHLALLYLNGLWRPGLIELCTDLCTASLVVALLLAAGLAGRLGRATGGAGAGAGMPILVVAALAADHYVLLNAVNGMETALAAAACTAIALAAVAGRPWALVGALTAGVLTRPECALFVVAAPLLPVMRRRGPLLALVAAMAAVVAARYALFGEWTPNTYAAKAGGTARHAALGLAYLGEAFADFPIALLAPLAVVALPRRQERRAAGYLLAVTAGWLAFFLRSGGDTFAYSRLFVPLVPALACLALAGAWALPARLGVRPRWAGGALAGALAVAVAARAHVAHRIPPQGTSPRVLQWAATGTYLRKHYPGALVATVPIGAIGYFSELPVLDLVGLTEPAIARAGRSVPAELLTKRWIGHERHHTEHVLARRPRVIVTTMHRPTAWRDLAEARAGFYADWLLLQEIRAGRAPYHVADAELAPGDHVLLFERDGAP